MALPTRRKEVYYFNYNFHRGEDWYLSHFPPASEESDLRCVGEVSPMYIYADLAPMRIAQFGSIEKLIVMLRSPETRLVSNYQALHKTSNHTTDRALFLRHHSIEFEQMRIFRYLSRFLEFFPREKFLFLTMDDLRDGAASAKDKLAGFLAIDAGKFEPQDLARRYNAAKQPRLKTLHRAARDFRDSYFRDFEWVTTVENRLPVLRTVLFQDAKPPPDWLLEELRSRKQMINEDTRKLEQATGCELRDWIIE